MKIRIPNDLQSLLVPLADIRLDPANANEHNDAGIQDIAMSIAEFGFDQPVLVRQDGQLIAGEGRYLAAQSLGMEAIPAVRTPLNSIDATRRGIGDNVIARKSKLNEEKLAALLASLRNEDKKLLRGTGYDDQAVETLLAEIAKNTGPGAENEPYSRKVEPPIYKPSNAKPSIAELFDDTRTQVLVRAIQAADYLTEDQRRFLTIAAQRHTVLHFNKIADYYAHSDERVQRLMEDSALVIIDFNRAIELGFVQLTKKIAEQVKDECGE